VFALCKLPLSRCIWTLHLRDCQLRMQGIVLTDVAHLPSNDEQRIPKNSKNDRNCQKNVRTMWISRLSKWYKCRLMSTHVDSCRLMPTHRDAGTKLVTATLCCAMLHSWRPSTGLFFWACSELCDAWAEPNKHSRINPIWTQDMIGNYIINYNIMCNIV